MEFETERKEISASEVPPDILVQIENYSRSKAEDFYQRAQNYFYGLNGCSRNLTIAEGLYKLAADVGHLEAQKKLKDFRAQIEYETSNQAENFYQKAQNYFYGRNGYGKNLIIAEGFYKRAASAGHSGAKNDLKTLYGHDY